MIINQKIISFFKKIISGLSLRLKFAIWTFMLMLIGMGTVSYFFIIRERESAIDSVKSRLWSIATPLAVGSGYKIVEKDILALKRSVEETSRIKHVLYAAVYDVKGDCICHSDSQAHLPEATGRLT